MPLLLDVKRQLQARSDRVKSISFSETENHVLLGLYNGSVKLYDYVQQTDLKTFELSDVPVRCVSYIARRNWFVAGSDDFKLRVFNVSTGEKIVDFEAHPDYIRCLAVHPTLPIVLTGSDDMLIKAWDYSQGWKCVQEFVGHTHYIMSLSINPKDPQTFASACLDHTVKMWNLASPNPNFSLEAHEKGVNYVSFYQGGDKPYLVTTGDDRTIKIWDYQNKSCVQTLESHSANVSFAVFHPSLPIIVSGSEDGSVKIWNANTYRLEQTLSYGLERCWCVAVKASGSSIGFGYDEGAVVIKLGKDEPSVSMDISGKVVYAKNTEILTANLQSLADETPSDGQKLAIQLRELGSTEVYPQSLQHSPNGRFVTVVGDGEFIIYTSLAWRNKAFGTGLSFAWAQDSNTYAVQESKSRIKVFRNFKERPNFLKSGTSGWTVEGVHGGTLLGARGSGFVMFWDWESGAVVRRIEVDAFSVSWSGSGTLVAISSAESLFILRFDREAYNARLDSGEAIGDEGVEEAFELVAEISETVRTERWIGDCFVYTNSSNRLNYLVGDQVHTINHFDHNMYLLGYIPAHNRVYVADKDMSIFSYALSLNVVEYQTAILRGDMEAAEEILLSIPQDQLSRVARFLEAQGNPELALEISTDPDHKFDLAIQLNDLETALDLVRAAPTAGSEVKWKTVGDKALAAWKIDLAQESYTNANDLPALLLIYTSTGDRAGLEKLAELALAKGQNNIAFTSFHQLGDTASCIKVLNDTGRAPEAALFARTYAPSAVPAAVKTWKSTLESAGRTKLAAALADPEEGDAALFEEGWEESLQKESSSAGEGSVKKVNGKVHAAVVEPVEHAVADIVDKVKDLTVGNGSAHRSEESYEDPVGEEPVVVSAPPPRAKRTE